MVKMNAKLEVNGELVKESYVYLLSRISFYVKKILIRKKIKFHITHLSIIR